MVESHNVIGVKVPFGKLWHIPYFHKIHDDIFYRDPILIDLENAMKLPSPIQIFRSTSIGDGPLNDYYYFGVEIPPIDPTPKEIDDAFNAMYRFLPRLRLIVRDADIQVDRYVVLTEIP